MMRPKQRCQWPNSHSSGSHNGRNCRKKCSLNLSQIGGVVGPAFVSNPAAVSEDLVKMIAPKACQSTTTVREAMTEEKDPSHGLAEPWLGKKVNPDTSPAPSASPPQKEVKIDEAQSCQIIPVTAKHIISINDEVELV